MTIVKDARAITGGVDTHADAHVAAALDPLGGLLGVREFPAAAAGTSLTSATFRNNHAPGKPQRSLLAWPG